MPRKIVPVLFSLLQYSSQIVETGAICLEFSPNFLHSVFTPLFSLKRAPLLPQCWAERILKHWNDCKPRSTLGRGKSHKCFKICDEDCSLEVNVQNYKELKSPKIQVIRYIHLIHNSFVHVDIHTYMGICNYVRQIYLAGLFVLMIKPFLIKVDIDDQAV